MKMDYFAIFKAHVDLLKCNKLGTMYHPVEIILVGCSVDRCEVLGFSTQETLYNVLEN